MHGPMNIKFIQGNLSTPSTNKFTDTGAINNHVRFSESL
jgi:hypothetical protein